MTTTHALKLRYVHRESLANLPLELELEGKFEDRQYKSPDPFIQTEREDTRLRFSAELRLYNRICVGFSASKT